jgi:hypothetical protein
MTVTELATGRRRRDAGPGTPRSTAPRPASRPVTPSTSRDRTTGPPGTVATPPRMTVSRRPVHAKRRGSRTSATTRPGPGVPEVPPPPLRRTPIPLREPAGARRLVDDVAATPLRVTQEALAFESPEVDEEIVPPPPSPAAPVVPATDREWATRFVHAATEVSSGLRSASQLIRWTTPDIQQALQRRAALAGRARHAGVYRAGKPFVRSLRISVVRPGVYEVTAVVGEVNRFRAVALRMQDLDGRWRVTALEMG